jgi:predicted outer membrane repeat protein
VYHNAALLGGAGIFSYFGTIGLFDNTTVHDNAASSAGGGIYQDGGALTLKSFSSITHNTATFNGGGLYASNSPTVTLWGAKAIRLNTPDNCFPVGAFPPCAG